MALFNKKEKKFRQELLKKSISSCKETLKEVNELYDDLKAAYEEIEEVSVSFSRFAATLQESLNAEQLQQLEHFITNMHRADTFARNALRDVRDLMRNQKKRYKEAQREL